MLAVERLRELGSTAASRGAHVAIDLCLQCIPACVLSRWKPSAPSLELDEDSPLRLSISTVASGRMRRLAGELLFASNSFQGSRAESLESQRNDRRSNGTLLRLARGEAQRTVREAHFSLEELRAGIVDRPVRNLAEELRAARYPSDPGTTQRTTRHPLVTERHAPDVRVLCRLADDKSRRRTIESVSREDQSDRFWSALKCLGAPGEQQLAISRSERRHARAPSDPTAAPRQTAAFRPSPPCGAHRSPRFRLSSFHAFPCISLSCSSHTLSNHNITTALNDPSFDPDLAKSDNYPLKLAPRRPLLQQPTPKHQDENRPQYPSGWGSGVRVGIAGVQSRLRSHRRRGGRGTHFSNLPDLACHAACPGPARACPV